MGHMYSSRAELVILGGLCLLMYLSAANCQAVYLQKKKKAKMVPMNTEHRTLVFRK